MWFFLFCFTGASVSYQFENLIWRFQRFQAFFSLLLFFFKFILESRVFERFLKSAFSQDHLAAEVFGNANEDVAPFTFSFKFIKDDNPLGGNPNVLMNENVGTELGNGVFESVFPVRDQSVAAVCRHLFLLLGWPYQGWGLGLDSWFWCRFEGLKCFFFVSSPLSGFHFERVKM